MQKLILAAAGFALAIGLAAPADAQWNDRWSRRDRDRTVVVEQKPLISTNTLAVILALEAARRAAEREPVRERSSREFVPLK